MITKLGEAALLPYYRNVKDFVKSTGINDVDSEYADYGYESPQELMDDYAGEQYKENVGNMHRNMVNSYGLTPEEANALVYNDDIYNNVVNGRPITGFKIPEKKSLSDAEKKVIRTGHTVLHGALGGLVGSVLGGVAGHGIKGGLIGTGLGVGFGLHNAAKNIKDREEYMARLPEITRSGYQKLLANYVPDAGA